MIRHNGKTETHVDAFREPKKALQGLKHPISDGERRTWEREVWERLERQMENIEELQAFRLAVQGHERRIEALEKLVTKMLCAGGLVEKL